MLNDHDKQMWDILQNIEYGYWYDSIYGIKDSAQEWSDYESEIAFLLSNIGNEPKNILEACCGTGRILIPLAEAGHRMTGFDGNYGMLARLHEKAKGLTNVKYYYADALRHAWEKCFDVVLLANNVIQNIEHIQNEDPAQEWADYKAAQELFIRKAADSLVRGGYFFFTFELIDRRVGKKYFVNEPDLEWFIDPEQIDMSDTKANAFGVRSKSINGGWTYDFETRLARGINRDINMYPPPRTKSYFRGQDV